MACKYCALFPGVLLFLLSYKGLAQKTPDGTELTTTKKEIRVRSLGKELPFSRSEVYTFRLKPDFHEHEGAMHMDTMLLVTRGWFRNYSGLESGLYALQLPGKNIQKLTRFTVSVGDPMSPHAGSDTIGVALSLSYIGPARFRKPFDISIHVDGSDAQSMAWGYMSALFDLPAQADSCISENIPAELGEFESGFIQDILLMQAMPARLRIHFSGSQRSMCVEAFEKKGIKTHWEIKNIILRFP